MRPQYNVFTRKLIFVSIMPQGGERVHGSLWQEAGGFYCYVWLETVGVLKKGKPGNEAIKTTRSVKNVRGMRERSVARSRWFLMLCLNEICWCCCCFWCCYFELFVCEQIRKTQAEPQWIVAQRLLSALTIPGFT